MFVLLYQFLASISHDAHCFIFSQPQDSHFVHVITFTYKFRVFVFISLFFIYCFVFHILSGTLGNDETGAQDVKAKEKGASRG
jgi:hypothetical protein